MWVENEARRVNRNLLLVNGLIMAILVVIVVLNYRYCANFLLGCQPISSAELAGIKSPAQRWRNFVRVTGPRSLKTGFRDVVNHVEKSSGRVLSTDVKDEYVLLALSGGILLVKAPPGAEKLEYSGELVPTEERVKADLLQQLAVQQPELGEAVLPFTLNAADYREQGYVGLLVMVPLFALAFWNCLKAMRRITEPQSTPVWKNLSAFGNAEQISSQIEGALQPATTRKYGKLRMASQWMIRRKLFSTWVSPVADLMWIYKKVTKHSVNFIPTGKTYSVILVGRHRQRIEEQMNEKATNELLMELAGRVPWALFGFDQKIEQAWRKDPGSLISAVDARMQKHNAKSAAAGA